MSAEMAALAAAVIMAEQVVQRLAQHKGIMAALDQQVQVFMVAVAVAEQVLLEQTVLVLLAGTAGMAWRPQLTAAVQLEQAAEQVEHIMAVIWVLLVQVEVALLHQLLALQTQEVAALVVWEEQTVVQVVQALL